MVSLSSDSSSPADCLLCLSFFFDCELCETLLVSLVAPLLLAVVVVVVAVVVVPVLALPLPAAPLFFTENEKDEEAMLDATPDGMPL